METYDCYPRLNPPKSPPPEVGFVAELFSVILFVYLLSIFALYPNYEKLSSIFTPLYYQKYFYFSKIRRNLFVYI